MSFKETECEEHSAYICNAYGRIEKEGEWERTIGFVRSTSVKYREWQTLIYEVLHTDEFEERASGCELSSSSSLAYSPWINGSVEWANRDIFQVLHMLLLHLQVDTKEWNFCSTASYCCGS